MLCPRYSLLCLQNRKQLKSLLQILGPKIILNAKVFHHSRSWMNIVHMNIVSHRSVLNHDFIEGMQWDHNGATLVKLSMGRS